jgi:hypothetical protein
MPDNTDNTASAVTSLPKAGSSLVAFWAVVVVAVILVGDAVIRSSWNIVSLSIAPAAFAVWAAWMLLFRPVITCDSAGLTTVNPGRIVRVPWQRVAAIRQRPQLVIELDDGSRVTCWGSPFPDKPGYRPSPARSRHESGQDARRAPESTDVVRLLEAARSAAPADGATVAVSRRFDLVPLSIGALLVLGCAVEFVISR